MLTQNASTAYWVAFGPHGPRALPPPDEGKKVTLYVFAALFASLAIFSAMRMFAKPAPHTMNKEWQEAANEYLKVRIRQAFARSPSRKDWLARLSMLTLDINKGAKIRPNHRSRLPQLRGQGTGPVPLLESLRGSGSKRKTFPLSVERAEATYSLSHGPNPMYTVIFIKHWSGDGLDGDCVCGRSSKVYENQKILNSLTPICDISLRTPALHLEHWFGKPSRVFAA